MQIYEIIPRMIFGIVLIIGWLPVIVLTERNNKGNKEENNKLLDLINNKLILTDITNQITYNETSYFKTFGGTVINNVYTFPSSIINDYGNFYLTVIENTTTIDEKNKKITKSSPSTTVIFSVLINNELMNENNYLYLAMQNKIISSSNLVDPDNKNINYDINIYSIPKNKMIMKVEGLQDNLNELDMIIYDYEFGPEDQVIQTIKDRKELSNKFQMWVGRLGTFLMLFVGLALIISPFTAIVELGNNLPGPLKIFAIPGNIILSIYHALNLIGSLVLTVLMTFFIWSLINYPLISIIIGGLLIGFILYFSKYKN
jgi:hypothetical protein